MKKILISLTLAMMAVLIMPANAQSILDAEEGSLGHYYQRGHIAKGKKAVPYEYVRESDIVWETCIWRTIDFKEKFNQFFYFPTDPTENTQDRVNLANALYAAVSNGDIEVFEDDEMKIPLEWSVLESRINKIDTVTIPGDVDEWGDQITPDRDSVVMTAFDAKDYEVIKLKEFWYIDKEDTRQKVRLIGLALVQNSCKERDGEMECTQIDKFWVPMDDMRVRNILVKVNAYDENNNSLELSYDEIFISRYFDSFVTRESNRANRSVSDYLTGLEAIVESQNIEEKIFNIESDMWEY